ncbi:Crp/Fnr family transcriptional regulator [Zhouia amylolytica]|nr:Crp/Fnr family transcriptional regulator [Zhouia amylolytica]
MWYMESGFKTYQKYLDSLRENPLLNTVSDSELNNLLQLGSAEEWPKKTCIIDCKRALYKFHIIISGRLKIYKTNGSNNRHLTLFMLRKGDMFDVLSLLDNQEHHVYYETLDELKVLCIPIVNMKTWIDKNPGFTQNLLTYLTKQIRTLENYVIDVSLEDTSTRLAKLLLNHSNKKSNTIDGISDLSHDELAGMIGTTRAVVNRQLQHLREEGIIDITRKHITINNIEALIKITESNK